MRVQSACSHTRSHDRALLTAINMGPRFSSPIDDYFRESKLSFCHKFKHPPYYIVSIKLTLRYTDFLVFLVVLPALNGITTRLGSPKNQRKSAARGTSVDPVCSSSNMGILVHPSSGLSRFETNVFPRSEKVMFANINSSRRVLAYAGTGIWVVRTARSNLSASERDSERTGIGTGPYYLKHRIPVRFGKRTEEVKEFECIYLCFRCKSLLLSPTSDVSFRLGLRIEHLCVVIGASVIVDAYDVEQIVEISRYRGCTDSGKEFGTSGNAYFPIILCFAPNLDILHTLKTHTNLAAISLFLPLAPSQTATSHHFLLGLNSGHLETHHHQVATAGKEEQSDSRVAAISSLLLAVKRSESTLHRRSCTVGKFLLVSFSISSKLHGFWSLRRPQPPPATVTMVAGGGDMV
ncbi:hypothetical protein LXL04_017122 [Taraxacum kok-saghyz]